ncbi:MAG TPA: hypothetical protein VMU05_11485 [Dongiaceae bacterium]|nr:hypothetical protein [Dongiaceae bacterium]
MGDRKADDFLKGQPDKVGETAIASADVAFQAQSEENVVERVDQVAESLLRLGDHLKELLELLVVGRRGSTMIEALDQAFELGNLLRFAPDVGAEKANQKDEADGKGFQMKPGILDGIPGKPGEHRGDEEQQEESESPEFVLPLFIGFETRNYLIPKILRQGVLGFGIAM